MTPSAELFRELPNSEVSKVDRITVGVIKIGEEALCGTMFPPLRAMPSTGLVINNWNVRACT